MRLEVESLVAVKGAEAHPGRADTEARERFAAEHLPLVSRLCSRYRHSGVPLEDLVQVGSVGLVKAIDKFEPERGFSFAAFAIPVILGEVKNYFRDHGWAVKVPRKLQTQRMMVEKAVDSLSQMDGRSPTIAEIVAKTGLTQDQVHDTMEVGKYGHPVSLEAEYEDDGSGNGPNILEFLGSEDRELSDLADKIDLHNTFGELPERERAIIHLKFYEDLSQSEIAKRLGISQMHVSRLQRDALAKIRRRLGEGALAH